MNSEENRSEHEGNNGNALERLLGMMGDINELTPEEKRKFFEEYDKHLKEEIKRAQIVSREEMGAVGESLEDISKERRKRDIEKN